MIKRINNIHKRITAGWSVLSAYFYLLIFGSAQEALIIKLFPDYAVLGAASTVVFYTIFLAFLYYIGKGHEHLQKNGA